MSSIHYLKTGMQTNTKEVAPIEEHSRAATRANAAALVSAMAVLYIHTQY